MGTSITDVADDYAKYLQAKVDLLKSTKFEKDTAKLTLRNLKTLPQVSRKKRIREYAGTLFEPVKKGKTNDTCGTSVTKDTTSGTSTTTNNTSGTSTTANNSTTATAENPNPANANTTNNSGSVVSKTSTIISGIDTGTVTKFPIDEERNDITFFSYKGDKQKCLEFQSSVGPCASARNVLEQLFYRMRGIVFEMDGFKEGPKLNTSIEVLQCIQAMSLDDLHTLTLSLDEPGAFKPFIDAFNFARDPKNSSPSPFDLEEAYEVMLHLKVNILFVKRDNNTISPLSMFLYDKTLIDTTVVLEVGAESFHVLTSKDICVFRSQVTLILDRHFEHQLLMKRLGV